MAAEASSRGEVVVRAGDLLDAREPFIAHQCNCVSKSARGVAKSIFARFPEANVYRARAAGGDEPGRIAVRGRVVNMFAQVHPGAARRASDSAAARLGWFVACLEAMVVEIPALDVVAMPFGIGCGLAGGHWADYKAAIDTWATKHALRVVLYKLG